MSTPFWLPDNRNNILRYVNSVGIISTPTLNSTDPIYISQGGLKGPWSVAVNRAGTFLYVVDQISEVVYQVNTSTFEVICVAGRGVAGWTFQDIYGVAVDSKGNIYVSDTRDVSVVAVNMQSTAQTILGVNIPAGQAAHVVSGSSPRGFAGDGGPAIAAEIWNVFGIAIDSLDNLLCADQLNNRIRKVNAVTGIIDTVVGSGPAPTVQGGGSYTGDGGPATAATLNSPLGVAVDSADNYYITDLYNQVVRVVNNQSTPQTLLGTLINPGDIQTVSVPVPHETNIMWFCNYDNAGSRLGFCNPESFTPPGGNIWAVNSAGAVVSIAGTGTFGTPTGDGGLATVARVGEAFGMTFAPSVPGGTGNIIVAKSVVPNTSTQSFTFRPSWAGPFALANGQSVNSGPLVPGTYSITEDALSNWDTVITVSNGNLPDAIRINSGDTVTVTFTNTFAQPVCFADGIVPAGAIDGVNTSFTLPTAPNPPGSLILESDTSLLAPGVGFSLSFVLNGAQLTLAYPPKTSLVAWYRFICGAQTSIPPLYKLNPDQAFDDNAFTATPTAINSTYFTYGFVNAAKSAQNPLLGFHRKRFSEIQMNVNGSGQFIVTTFPNYILKRDLSYNPYAYVVPPILLQTDPPDDLIRPLNSVGNRVYVKFETNAVGAAFDISKAILIGVMDSYNVVNPNV